MSDKDDEAEVKGGDSSCSSDEEITKLITKQNSDGVESPLKVELERRLRLLCHTGKNMKNKDWRIIEGIMSPSLSMKFKRTVKEAAEVKRIDKSF